MPAGIKGIGLQGELPIPQRGGALGLSPFLFDLTQATFVAAMSKRNSAGPFAAGVLAQGKRDGTGTGDRLSAPVGSVIATGFDANVDISQGSVVFWITPEWDSTDGITHVILDMNSTIGLVIYKNTTSLLTLYYGGQTVSLAPAWSAGTTYCVCVRYDTNNTLDGTNYACISVNDVHIFGISTKPTALIGSAIVQFIGSNNAYAQPGSSLIEGFTIYRRPLWDGAYGVNVGNGDELALIYAAGAGADPCTITGSWDVCLCVPTNSTVGALVTGTGEAWSHPHSSNLLTDGWLQSYYGGEPWSVKFNGTTTKIDCGSGATLDDLPNGAVMQVEGWVRHDGTTTQVIISKGGVSTATGWSFYVDATGYPIILVDLATTNATATHTTTIEDGKWHHVLAHYNDATRIAQVAVDGVWGAAGGAGTGAYVTDAALNVNIGMATSGTAYYWTGAIGWINIYNNAFYTPGTNFQPPRTPPAADVEEWLLNEGTGVTATAQVTSPANDGTITNGTWQPQWYAEGTPIVPTSVQGSASYRADVGSGATIDDLADNAFTVEGWFRIPKTGTVQYLCTKGLLNTSGWIIYNTNGNLVFRVHCATSGASSISIGNIYADGLWHYLKFTFDDAGDRKPYIYVDNVLIAQTQTAGVGAVVSDAALNGYIGTSVAGANLTGAHGWIRWSNVVRGAGMISRSTPPDPTDANTMGQWNGDEGALAVLTDMSGEGNHGAMAGTYTWINTGAMDLDSPGARVYGWGDAVGSDAVSEGKKITFTGLTAGADYVLRALAYSEDGVGIPRVEVYDETNAAQITAITGLATSTEWVPDVFIISFELPTNARGAAADCTSISIKRISTTAGNVGWHQCEVYAANGALDNPSMDTGAVADPFVPYGWTNSGLDAGDTEAEAVVRHSEGASVQFNTTAVAGEKLTYQLTLASGLFFSFGVWTYGDGSAGFKLNGVNAVLHSNPAVSTLNTPHTAAWTRTAAVWRATAANPTIEIEADDGASGARYVDDIVVL